MEEVAETSTMKGIRKREWVEWLGETNVILVSNWIPRQLTLTVSADQDPMNMPAALEQRKQQQ